MRISCWLSSGNDQLDVVIESDTSELLATGMTILLDQQFVKFKSHVRGRHDPQAQ
jgi:lipopolysaccharide export system protein LptC